MEYKELDIKAKSLRKDVLDMIYNAQSGHPGGSLSIIEMLLAIYHVTGNFDKNDKENSDKLVLSKGHAAPALYAVLADLGYFPKEDLKKFRQIDSHLQGHPDMHKTPGVDMSTGSLGQGISAAVGFALGGKYFNKKYNVYTIVGDGEIQEGLVWEAAMSAANYKLDNLIVLLDYNHLQIDGSNDEVMCVGDVLAKFKAFGFECFEVNGHDIGELVSAISMQIKDKPKFICCNTSKGKGVSFMENVFGWHGKAPNEEQYNEAIKELGV